MPPSRPPIAPGMLRCDWTWLRTEEARWLAPIISSTDGLIRYAARRGFAEAMPGSARGASATLRRAGQSRTRVAKSESIMARADAGVLSRDEITRGCAATRAIRP